MGKSTVASLFAHCGVPVHDSDKATHRAYEPKSPVFSEIARAFPKSWDRKTRTIDRQKLGQIVFADPDHRKTLENIIHPYVWSEQAKFISLHQKLGTDVALFDIPLLYETHSQARFDYVVVATAPDTLQRQRALSRPGMSEEKFQRIRASQMPNAEKVALADFVVHTGLGKAFSMREVKSILAHIRGEGKTHA